MMRARGPVAPAERRAWVIRGGRREVERAVERLRRVNEPAHALVEAAEKIVGAFCLGLTRQPYPVDRFVAGAARQS